MLEELIEDQGEIALIIENANDECKIVKYALPKENKIFQGGEVRNAFLAQTMESPKYEDKDREILSKYLDTVKLPVAVNSQIVKISKSEIAPLATRNYDSKIVFTQISSVNSKRDRCDFLRISKLFR